MSEAAETSQKAIVPRTIAEHIVSPAAFAEWTGINADFAYLRRELPLAMAYPDGYDPFWVVTRYADVREVSHQPDIFPSNGYRCILSSKAALAEMDAPGAPPFLRALITMDPPEHWANRRLTFADFAPKGVKGLEDSIRAIAIKSVEEFLAKGGSADFVEDAAVRYPLRVILKLLGLPSEDEDHILRLTQAFQSPQDPDYGTANEGVALDHNVLEDYKGYFYSLVDRLRANPDDSISSKIANGMVNGKLLSHWEAMSQMVVVATAGHDTTSASTAGAMWALAERPDLVDRIRADRSLVANLVDEGVRWASPLLSFMRTAAVDYELRGQTIRKGDWIMMSYLSANRDENVFENPETFSLDRPLNVHLGFGHGPHLCLGRNIANLEMRIFYEELFKRLVSVELAGPPKRTHSANLCSIKSLPVNFTYQ
ncbi:cytochrome P450 [Sphingobium fluviale]|uniref:Cytochrome P450 n=1 Tax=Sphingobium fluviale TaxID=2506423 RepID=A0A4Q1KE64_9SPHN|nr:cytochrome P450 [Sphingobium fluviale]RXR26016.1 cytochrome P450 [Sphingobium fluviale]